MKTVNQQVWQAVESDPVIVRGLQRKLINVRALAKYLIATQNINATLDSVVSSLRRYPLEAYQAEEQTLHSIFKNSVVSTKNNFACLTIHRRPTEVFNKLCTVELPELRITTGTHAVKLLVQNSTAEKLAKLFKNVDLDKNLSEISVTVSAKAIKTKGVIARITAELALANINVRELLACSPQFLIYVSQKDLIKAHERIITLTS